MKESALLKPEHENILKTKNIDYNTRGSTLLEQSTDRPDIGPQFISQFHRNKFAGNKPALAVAGCTKQGLFSSMLIVR